MTRNRAGWPRLPARRDEHDRRVARLVTALQTGEHASAGHQIHAQPPDDEPEGPDNLPEPPTAA